MISSISFHQVRLNFKVPLCKGYKYSSNIPLYQSIREKFQGWNLFDRRLMNKTIVYKEPGIVNTNLKSLENILSFNGWGCLPNKKYSIFMPNTYIRKYRNGVSPFYKRVNFQLIINFSMTTLFYTK